MHKLNTDVAMDLFRNKCRAHGLKITPQRTVIYWQLIKAGEHPTIEVILEKVKATLPNISFDTVYRTVVSFSDIGIINIVEGFGGAMRFDPNLAQHHHFRCVKCNKIIDFYSDCLDNIKIPKSVRTKFNVLSKKVLLEGICGQCKRKKVTVHR